MKRNYQNIIINLISVALIIIFFFKKDLVSLSVINASKLFFFKVFPFLFVMFVIQGILVNYNLAYYLEKIFGKFLKKVFNLSSYEILVFFLSIIGGAPSNAILINDLYQKNRLEKKDANKLLSYTYFSNPLFLFGILSLIFPQIIAMKLIIIHYLTNVLLLLILKRKKIDNKTKYYYPKNFGIILTENIKKAINTNLIILGTICFFMILTNILTQNVYNPILLSIIKGFFELTQGLDSLFLISNSLLKEILAMAIISFGGLSIHTQVYSVISDTDLSYNFFLKGRVLSVIISIIIVLLTNC